MIDRDRDVLQLFSVLSWCWPKCGCFWSAKWSCVMYMLVMKTKMKSGALIRCINFPRNKWLSCDEKLNGGVRSINHRIFGYLYFLHMINQLFPENSIVSFIIWYRVDFIQYSHPGTGFTASRYGYTSNWDNHYEMHWYQVDFKSMA